MSSRSDNDLKGMSVFLVFQFSCMMCVIMPMSASVITSTV